MNDTTNQYVTVRTTDPGTTYESFYANTINFDGSTAEYGMHNYSHKRSARRAAISLAKKKDISYRQDLEYADTPHAFIAEKATDTPSARTKRRLAEEKTTA